MKDETPFKYAHTKIQNQVVVICDPTRYQVDHGGNTTVYLVLTASYVTEMAKENCIVKFLETIALYSCNKKSAVIFMSINQTWTVS